MPPDERFPRVVSLACHDLRTPLATIYGFARTLTRADELDERSQRFLSMIEEAAEQMTGLLDELGTAARIQAGRWEPGVREVSTLELASSDDERIRRRRRRRGDRDGSRRRRSQPAGARDRRHPARPGRAR